MRFFIYSMLATAATFAISGFKPQSPHAELVKNITLTMPAGSGTYGSSVAYHAGLKRYYTAFGGNTSHTFAIFDLNGNLVSTASQKTMVDLRGIWYNPGDKSIRCNTYSKNGWYKYITDANGIPEAAVMFVNGKTQPDDQSVGVMDEKGKRILFYKNDSLFSYQAETGQKISSLSVSLKEPRSSYLPNALCYFGGSKQEFCLLNTNRKLIEFFSAKDGKWTREVGFSATEKMPSVLGFAYCNGIFWLFDTGSRTWQGYKMTGK